MLIKTVINFLIRLLKNF